MEILRLQAVVTHLARPGGRLRRVATVTSAALLAAIIGHLLHAVSGACESDQSDTRCPTALEQLLRSQLFAVVGRSVAVGASAAERAIQPGY